MTKIFKVLQLGFIAWLGEVLYFLYIRVPERIALKKYENIQKRNLPAECYVRADKIMFHGYELERWASITSKASEYANSQMAKITVQYGEIHNDKYSSLRGFYYVIGIIKNKD